MIVYSPKVEVRLVKAIKRQYLVPDVPVAAIRYGTLDAIDLTPYLSQIGGVQTSKSCREPAGGFSITLADKPHIADTTTDHNISMYETLYALIEPMDLVEIRMAHNPVDYATSEWDYKIPVIMRGFVSAVTRNEMMNAGVPSRSVTIAGQDMGKILNIIQIFYLYNSQLAENYLTEFRFFQKYGFEGDAKIKTAIEFTTDIIKNVINPYLKRLTAMANGESVGAKVMTSWTPAITIQGVVSPLTISTFNNVSLYQLLATVLDVGPWNELYVEDTKDGVQMVGRPAPFLSVAGEAIQGVKPEEVKIDSKDVVAMNVARSDANVANYYWVQNERWGWYTNEVGRLLAMDEQAGKNGSTFIKFDYPNSDAARYGVRKLEVTSVLGPPDYLFADSVKKQDDAKQTASLMSWVEDRRRVLAEINQDNVVFESGTMRLRGNEKIRAGMQLVLSRGKSVVSSYYVVRVSHEFIPFQGFFTNVIVERGTNFISRAQSDSPMYFKEMDGGGVRNA